MHAKAMARYVLLQRLNDAAQGLGERGYFGLCPEKVKWLGGFQTLVPAPLRECEKQRRSVSPPGTGPEFAEF